jgi:hypothetical protein
MKKLLSRIKKFFTCEDVTLPDIENMSLKDASKLLQGYPFNNSVYRLINYMITKIDILEKKLEDEWKK